MLIERDLNTSAISEEALATFSQNDKEKAADFIAHHGIKGQKWGQRRYQNSDGSLTTLGRARYGVGAAAKKTGQALGKAGSTAGKAIGKAARKAVGRQTDEELNAELAKARKTHERAMKKAEIDDLTGKKKKLSKMTDAEVDAYIDRLAKEKSVRQAEKDLKRMNQNAAQRFMSDLGGAVGSGITEGVKRGVSGQIETSFRKSAERHQKVKDSRFDKNHPDEKNESKKLKEEADDSRNRVEAARNKLELEALGGDEKATERLYNVATAKKGGKKEKGDGGKKSDDGNKEETPKKEKQKESKRSSDDTVEADSYEIPRTKKDGSVTYDIVQRTPTTKETVRWIDEMAKHKIT